MASYFTSIPVSIPYSWQKRLLLFALNRLDFIDTHGLDLDNLGGLTWGRRSVVELKNVLIKIETLAERANLPPSIAVENASIAVLRLTVPADLSTDPINVEVEGVRIMARLRKDDSPQVSGKGADTSPSHKDRANRPRLASHPTHDPGGRSHRPREGMHLEVSHVIPTSEDLAASFLESETRAEREELEAIVGSHSQFMTESVSSASSGNEDDTGLGLPAGFALPTFLTSYFQGIADHLTLKITNVEVSVRLELTPLDGAESDESIFIIRVDNFDIGSLKRQVEAGAVSKPPRRLALRGLHIDLEVDQDVFSHPSSPRLDRQSLKSSSSHLRGSVASDEQDDRSDATTTSFAPFASDIEPHPAGSRQRRPAFTSLVASASSSSADPEPSVSSLASSPGIASPDRQSQLLPTASRLGASSEIDNLVQAQYQESSSMDTSDGLGIGLRSNDLTESTLFTHEEAESMYMSAVSQASSQAGSLRQMPGAWDWSNDLPTHVEESVEQSPQMAQDDQLPRHSTEKEPSPDFQADSRLERPFANHEDRSDSMHAAETDAPEVPTPTVSHAVLSRAPESLPEALSVSKSNTVRLASLESLTIVIPEQKLADATETSRPRTYPRHEARKEVRQSTYSSTLSTSRLPTQPLASKPASSAPNKTSTYLETGQLRMDVDLGICKLLVRIAGNILKMLPPRDGSAEQQAPPSSSIEQHLLPNIKLGEMLFNFHEGRSLRASLGQSECPNKLEDALLSLSLKGLELVNEDTVLRRLMVSSIKIRHAAQDVMWFVETVNVRESIASSAMLKPHDLTLTMDGERTEVFIKPVHVVVDLLLVDDVLSRGGGLDSLLDLGNSIMSTHNSITPPKQTSPKLQQRTVRFNTPDHSRPRSGSEPSSGLGKLNIRVGGSIIDLVGSAASIQVKTSAIKFVLRPAAARVVVDGAMIEGPILDGAKAPTPIFIKVKALELVYCDVPEEGDLDRLLSLITPSNDKYDKDDDIMVDTLLNQRRKAGVLHLEVADVQLDVQGFEWQQHIAKLSDELAKLSSVTKYLPEDDRPGLLTFALLQKFGLRFAIHESFGPLFFKAELLEGAHIAMPALTAAQVSSWSLARNKDDLLIGEVLAQNDVMSPPMLMCRFIAGEMEPTVRIKLTNTSVEYKVTTLMAITDLLEKLDLSSRHTPKDSSQPLSPASSRSSEVPDFARKVKVSLVLRDSAAALYPLGSSAKGLFILTDTTVSYESQKRGPKISLDMKKASLLIINSTVTLGAGVGNADEKLYFDQNDQIQKLTKLGYVPVASLTSVTAAVNVVEQAHEPRQRIDVELNKALLFMETCADSTQTLGQILGALSPPSAPSKDAQYRTEVIPIENLLASFTGNAFVSEAGRELGMDASQISAALSHSLQNESTAESGLLGGVYEEDTEAAMEDSYISDMASSIASSSIHIAPVDVTAPDPDDLAQSVMVHSMLDFREDHFTQKPSDGSTAHRWNSAKNTYELANEAADQKSPLTVKARNFHIIWNLFDGYDWQGTRDTISQAVRNIEEKAMSKRPGTKSPGIEEDDDDVIGDVLFNSIYISIPANKDPRDLTSAINHDIDDMVSETGSYATSTTVTATPSRQVRRQSGLRPRPKKLKLSRSKNHKISFELQGLVVDFIAFPSSSGEVQSSIDVRVHKLEVFDNVPTSTWKKFATYLHEAGEREVDKSMVHIEMLNVKPVPDLAASEIVMKVTVLPLRLHVDQDALDFMTRFFEFKDESDTAPSTPSTPPFIQRVEVNPVKLQLDYKPKKVDYAGLRSGRTTEFMNFMILERTNIVLRRVILYGVSGFDRMGITLNNIWSPDVRRNQLPTVLAGLAPVRPLVDVASGVRELIAVPIREYQKDGRLVRSIQKGAAAFAKTTATELVNLGAKLAVGTQQVLQNTEGVLVANEKEMDTDEEATKQISLYADQPVGIVQGLRGAYASLERDLLLARDAIVAVPGEVMASGTAAGAARAVLKQSPTIILRPAIGATKAVGQTLMGAGNALDKRNLRRIEDVSARHPLSCRVDILSPGRNTSVTDRRV
ncbi:uncharacterized protein HMPREF1541_00975 [Cyphellophora europaea CBS 101466]|uniref:Autophagy-related protein 2 n=1 Tax=Cyphellophora europaea (strain CBS 101466) TaxID=1220924 RepID=W2SDH7_CYPE1|nr:uncharacterized protein HMPREF1541_00975 [Cyphellophora europaea CBS 101466]ETN46786.1 hypothetical protein HMPREF1541_00975 [Cyphellophora europaea CBS 101466]